MSTFRDKYFALPGDMTNAVIFWGAADGGDGLGLDCYETDSTGLKTTCNGNGDGIVTSSSTLVGNEKFRFWQHLANAGLIEGSYSGRAAVTTGAANRSVGIQMAGRIPLSKISGGAYDIEGIGTALGYAWAWDGYYGTTIYFGASDQEGAIGDLLEGAIITPADQWNIDTKMDDGKPSYGKIRAYQNSVNCNTNVSQATAAYRVDVTDKVCFIMYSTGY
ncbi:MAG: hypothetical protein ACOYNL_00090 [Rickettsiales bacterium]